VSARIRTVACFAIVAIIGLPALLLGIYGHWNYPVFYDLTLGFAICLFCSGLLSVALLLLCLISRRTAIFAVFFTALWVVLLLPETQYYIGTRGATEDSIVEPFYRQHQVLGYIFVLLPVPFVISGFWRRHTERSNHAMERTADRAASTF
jgi:hypothetical protein